MKKVLIGLISIAIMMSLFLVGCTNASQTDEKNDVQTGIKEEKYKVAMITSAGGLGDRSYNDSGYEGLKKAEQDLGIEIKVVEPNDVSEGEKYLSELAKAGYNLVMTLEYGHADIVNRVAPMYPETQFAVFNTVVDQPNVTSVVFSEHQGSFLAGMLAARVTSDKDIEQVNDKKVISVIGGTESPGIDKFIVGFEEGAHYVDPEVKVIKGYANSFADPAKGKEMALSQISQGSDVVFHVAGGTGEGVFAAAKEKNVFAIGVDSDQDYIAPGNILTSVMKRMDNAVLMLARMLKEGKVQDAGVLELGLDKGVELSPMQYTKDILKSEYIEEIQKAREEIIKGKLIVTDVSKQ